MALLTNINGKFSVSDAGAVRFNDAFTFPTVDGTANYVLKTNGSGQLAWAPDANTGTVTGSGTANTMPVWTSASALGNSIITQPSSANVRVSGSSVYFSVTDTSAAARNIDIGHWVAGQTNIESVGGILSIGTQSNHDIVFETNGSTKATILANGNVGIGTNSPSSKLQVSGDAYVTEEFGQGVAIANKVTTYGAEFRSSGASAQVFFGRSGNDIGSGAIGADSSYVFRVWKPTDFSQPFVIEQGGNVGIGTTSPFGKLSVNVTAGAPASSGNMTNGLTVHNTNGGRAIQLGVNESGGYTYLQSAYVNNAGVAQPMAFFTGATEKMRIDSSGLTTIKRTGITGVAKADMTLQIGYEGNNGQNNLIGFGYNAQTNIPAYIGYTTTSGSGSTKGDLVFGTRSVTTNTAPSERMRIDSSGIMHIMGATPSVNNSFQLQYNSTAGTAEIYSKSTGGNTSFEFYTSDGGVTSKKLTIANDGTSTLEGHLYLKSAANQGQLFFGTADNQYEIFGGGMWGYLGYNTGGYHRFFTSGTERMRITSSGTIFMHGLGGYTSSNADVRYATSSKELYYQTSSKRYKTNILNLENSLDKINKLRPVRYVDINTEEPACGLIAEETVEIIPEVVFTKEIEGFDKPQVEGINYSDLVPFLIKSIQELKAEIELLKNK